MSNTITCTTCKKENPSDLKYCMNCGTPLAEVKSANTTVSVPEQPLRPVFPAQFLELTQLYADLLLLQVLGYEQPILIKGSTQVTLGRFSPGEAAPSIDLTPYNAGLLGVSRQHAEITRPADEYLIADLGSTNGTWLNEVKLTPHKHIPIRNGDLVRLGQLAFYVYFRTPEEKPAVAVEETIQLKAETPFKLTARTLETVLSPYLMALAGIQAICDQMLERGKTAEVAITSIALREEKVAIQLSGAADATHLAHKHFTAWRSDNSARVDYLTQKAVNAENGATSSPVPAAVAEAPNGKTGQFQKELREAELKLALEMLRDLAPNRGDESLKANAEKLLAYLHVLALSPLQLEEEAP
ncbi:MAG: FHA domain-containing protein [Anaerolineae bacterium]|nr:FHA domain-containing protein [Anaerolineae bacterium]